MFVSFRKPGISRLIEEADQEFANFIRTRKAILTSNRLRSPYQFPYNELFKFFQECLERCDALKVQVHDSSWENFTICNDSKTRLRNRHFAVAVQPLQTDQSVVHAESFDHFLPLCRPILGFHSDIRRQIFNHNVVREALQLPRRNHTFLVNVSTYMVFSLPTHSRQPRWMLFILE